MVSFRKRLSHIAMLLLRETQSLRHQHSVHTSQNMKNMNKSIDELSINHPAVKSMFDAVSIFHCDQPVVFSHEKTHVCSVKMWMQGLWDHNTA